MIRTTAWIQINSDEERVLLESLRPLFSGKHTVEFLLENEDSSQVVIDIKNLVNSDIIYWIFNESREESFEILLTDKQIETLRLCDKLAIEG